MNRITNPLINVQPLVPEYSGAKFSGIENMPPARLNIILNGATLNSVNKPELRNIIRQLYERLSVYEGTNSNPEDQAYI